MQRQVFPRGGRPIPPELRPSPPRPNLPSTSLDQRLDALERQMADLLRQSEENGHRLQTLEGDSRSVRTDQDRRIGALELRINEAAGDRSCSQPPPRTRICRSPALRRSRPSRVRKSTAGHGGGGRGFQPTSARPRDGCRRGRLHAGLPAVGGRAVTTRRSRR